MILILTEPDDSHATLVEKKLQRQGQRFFRFDPAEFPSNAALSVCFSKGEKRVLIKTGEDTLDLSDCEAVWLRRPGRVQVHAPLKGAPVQSYVEQECEQFLDDLWNALETRWLPGPRYAIRRADSKQLQLQTAARLGMEIPATLITNDPDEFLEFYRAHPGGLIDKMPSVVMARHFGETMVRYTEPVTAREVGYCRRLRYSPMLFQVNVPKRFELRITVVEDQVFAAEIHSQASNHTRQDWRRYDLEHTPHRIHALPDHVRQQCIALVAMLGLRYGAIDMIVTPDDRYVFLEINPNGQWQWIEEATGLPISDAICSLLVSHA